MTAVGLLNPCRMAGIKGQVEPAAPLGQKFLALVGIENKNLRNDCPVPLSERLRSSVICAALNGGVVDAPGVAATTTEVSCNGAGHEARNGPAVWRIMI